MKFIFRSAMARICVFLTFVGASSFFINGVFLQFGIVLPHEHWSLQLFSGIALLFFFCAVILNFIMMIVSIGQQKSQQAWLFLGLNIVALVSFVVFVIPIWGQ